MQRGNFALSMVPLMAFDDYLSWLADAQQQVRSSADFSYRTLLLTSHPTCFTMGRGLREHQQQDPHQQEQEFAALTAPLYHINRGGGLTQHHPGQLIFYPVFHLNRYPKSLLTFMYTLLLIFQRSIEELYSLTDLSIPKDRFGLWCGEKKIASIGMGLERFVTGHGLALNLSPAPDGRTALCGLNPERYSSLAELLQWPPIEDESFYNEQRNKIIEQVLFHVERQIHFS